MSTAAAKRNARSKTTLPDKPDSALAYALAEAAAGRALLFVDATGSRLEQLAAMAGAFRPDLEILTLPAWDTLPYDRVAPSPAVVGQRVRALARLAEAPDLPRLVLTSARALLQRVPAPAHWATALMSFAPGDELVEEDVRNRLAEFGYAVDEHVDRPGEVAMRGQVIDLFPGDTALPARIELEGSRVAGLHHFDPVSQRRLDDLDRLVVRPVVEGEPPPEQVEAAADRIANPDEAEQQLETVPIIPPPAGQLESGLFEYLGDMPVVVHPDAAARMLDIEAEVADAYQAAVVAGRVTGQGAAIPRPNALYRQAASVSSELAERDAVEFGGFEAEPLPTPRDLGELVKQIRAAGDARVLLAADSQVTEVTAALKRRRVKDAVTALAFDLHGPGFASGQVHVLSAPARLLRPAGSAHNSGLVLEEPPRLSDIVVHGEHGVCRLKALRMVGEEERLALEFYEGTELLVPHGDLAQLWRYGSEAGHVPLDRLHGDAWHRRRDEIEAQVIETAEALAAAATRRANTKAPTIEPSPAYTRVVERFPYPPTPDQDAAIEAVLADLAAGRPMDRLVCGDVGFGKTEVALRAAAAAALAGYQVAIVAPTTVLARQHLETFRRRLAGTGLRVEPLLRGAAGAGAATVREGLADGSIGVVVGTQAIASDKVRFKRLGLVVIDEEQRFGDADKRKLAALKSGRGTVHTLVMTATPIPRTLQSAMVGLRDVSVIATPPVRRQPTRTFLLPWSEAIVREALGREHGRGGQSFVVAPRIEDLAPLEAQIRRWLPNLSLAVAHGKLKPERLEELVAGFTGGDADVLLATNIIEAGLDIPRANTILITGPHRFGLAQLHQMRGRVGRGVRRGMAYVLTDPGLQLGGPTARRLRTLETMEGLGAGVSIAAADLDTRGAGDLFGNVQAGHVHAIGTELYQRLLARELARIEGRPPEPAPPTLHLEIEGRIPDGYVPESNLRLDLYRRLSRIMTLDDAEDFAAELADRFGEPPPATACLLDEARLRAWCVTAGVSQVDAGPKATAFTLADADAAVALARRLPDATAKERRVLIQVGQRTPAERLRGVLQHLGAVADV